METIESDHESGSLELQKTPWLDDIDGVDIYTAHSFIHYKDRPDYLVIICDNLSPVAMVTTQSQTRSAAVMWCEYAYKKAQSLKLLLVNAGNANAFTGRAGKELVEHNADFFAKKYHVQPFHIFQASTGVIGQKMHKSALSDVFSKVKKTNWNIAAEAILTTDTYVKKSKTTFIWKGKKYLIQAISKGSGMISPNMATMLSFFITNAPIPQRVLQRTLSKTIPTTFNAISVDTDTSTSDTVLLIGCHHVDDDYAPEDEQSFYQALHECALDAALHIVRDGEGARKLIKVHVTRAPSLESAKEIAFHIVNSPLVKTAIAGEDDNWGRIIMAIGKSRTPIKQELIEIFFGPIKVTQNGELCEQYDENACKEYLKHDQIEITVNLQQGDSEFCAYGCDLTHEYVSINADYRS